MADDEPQDRPPLSNMFQRWNKERNKRDVSEAKIPVVEAERGVPFFLFPPEQPILYKHLKDNKLVSSIEPSAMVVTPDIRINGIDGNFHLPFTGLLDLHTPGELNHRVKEGDRIVLASAQGSVEITSSDQVTRVGESVKNRKITQMIMPSAPLGMSEDSRVSLKVLMPKFTIEYPKEGYDTENFNNAVFTKRKEENGADISVQLVPTDPDFLHKIQVVIE